jgi:hypothetical protein
VNKLTFCSDGPTPITKTFPPKTTDWKDQLDAE